jgi:hypothetical protein
MMRYPKHLHEDHHAMTSVNPLPPGIVLCAEQSYIALLEFFLINIKILSLALRDPDVTT